MMTCEMCGCTDEMACIEIPSGKPCHWTRPGLCSACDEIGGPGLAIRSWPLPDPEHSVPTSAEPAQKFDVLDFDDAVYEEVQRLGVVRGKLELVIDSEIRRGIAQLQTQRDAHRVMNTWQGIDLVELRENRGGYWNVRRKA